MSINQLNCAASRIEISPQCQNAVKLPTEKEGNHRNRCRGREGPNEYRRHTAYGRRGIDIARNKAPESWEFDADHRYGTQMKSRRID